VGYSSTAGNALDTFSYSGGVMTDLGGPGVWLSVATGINASGQIVGYSYTAGNTASNAFLYSGGVMTDLDTADPLSVATGINDSGQIVGYVLPTADGGEGNPVLFSGGVATNLGSLGGGGAALGINASGEIVGSSNLPGDAATDAFLYSGGVLTDIGNLGGSISLATFPLKIRKVGRGASAVKGLTGLATFTAWERKSDGEAESGFRFGYWGKRYAEIRRWAPG
jgi:probable HAF family extracellular repeat protein